MQNYTEITEDTVIEDSRELLLDNDKTIASHYSGTAFPTENLVIGMECYRTDQKIKYRLTNLSPVTWEATLTSAAVVKIKVDNAVHADTAGNAETTDSKHANDAAGNIALKDGSNDLNCRLLRATYANQNTISGAIAFRVNNTNDNYTRYCSDAGAIRNFIGLGNVNNTADANKTVKAATTATNVSGGTVSATNITATNGRLEATGTSSNLPQILLHIPNVNYSRLRMSTDGVIHAQNGGSDAYINMKAANFIGNLSGKATTAGTADNANKLGGLALAGARNNAANQVVRTDGNGYAQFGWINTTSGAVGSINKIYCSNDDYIRYMTVANFKVALGINNVNNTADSAKSVNYATSAGTAANANKLIGKNWNWSGQGGQPTWLWGGSDGTNMYVYNPSNFSVASAAKLTTARTINGVAFDGTKNITLPSSGVSVAVLTGTIKDGGTIPLPSGYSQAQCKWTVSINSLNTTRTSNADGVFGAKVNSNRAVTCTYSAAGAVFSGTINYIIIGMK